MSYTFLNKAPPHIGTSEMVSGCCRSTASIYYLFVGFVLFRAQGENDVVFGRERGHQSDRVEADD